MTSPGRTARLRWNSITSGCWGFPDTRGGTLNWSRATSTLWSTRSVPNPASTRASGTTTRSKVPSVCHVGANLSWWWIQPRGSSASIFFTPFFRLWRYYAFCVLSPPMQLRWIENYAHTSQYFAGVETYCHSSNQNYRSLEGTSAGIRQRQYRMEILVLFFLRGWWMDVQRDAAGNSISRSQMQTE